MAGRRRDAFRRSYRVHLGVEQGRSELRARDAGDTLPQLDDERRRDVDPLHGLFAVHYLSEFDMRMNLVSNVARSDASNASDKNTRTGFGYHSLSLEGPWTSWMYFMKAKAFSVPALSSQEDEVASAVRATRGLAILRQSSRH